MIGRVILCGLLLASAAGAQDSEHQWVLLGRIKHHMARNQSLLPNYTCLETITRSEAAGPSRPFKMLDVVRLEVAQVGKRELFAWPGSRGFEEKSLSELIGSGTVATGDFALHARAVFQSIVPVFSYLEEAEMRGRRTYHYEYRISAMNSGYRIRTGGGEAVVAYHGAFWADAQSLDLVRLDVVADEIPPELGIAGASTRIYYEKARIGTSGFLLPQTAELVLTHASGAARLNRIEFSNCRQYSTETVLSFDPAPDEAPSPAATPAAAKELRLPADLVVHAELETVIDSGKSAIGDAVTAKVVREIKHEGRAVVPRGARLTGRLRKLSRSAEAPDHFMITLEFSEIAFENSRGPFAAHLQEFGASDTDPAFAGARLGSLADSRRIQRLPRRSISFQDSPGVGTFLIRTRHLRLPRGFRMVWKTVAPPP